MSEEEMKIIVWFGYSIPAFMFILMFGGAILFEIMDIREEKKYKTS